MDVCRPLTWAFKIIINTGNVLSNLAGVLISVELIILLKIILRPNDICSRSELPTLCQEAIV